MGEQTAPPRQALFSRQDLLRLIIPLVIEQLLLMTVGMADTVMVTTSGEAAVSGVSLVDNLNLLVIQIFAALSTGGAVVVSQYLGRREEENACTAARQLLYTVVFVSTVLMVLALVLRQHILLLIFGRVQPAVMDSALIYFLLTALAYPFISVYNAGAALFRSMGNSKVSMFCSLLVNIINIAVNAVFIYGFHMGAAGAGIGTLASRVAAAVIIMALLNRPYNTVRVTGILRVRLRWDMIRRLLFIGVPNGMENGMFQVDKLLVLNLITSFGTASVAANAIANSISGVLIVPGQALGLSLITVVGRCMGARDPAQAVGYTKKLVGICGLLIGALGVVSFFAAVPLTGIFNLSPQAADMAARVLRLSAFFYILFWPLAFTPPNALRAAGDAIFTMIISLCSMFACRVVLSYAISAPWGLGLGLAGVWLAMCADWIVRAAFFLVRFWRGRWKSIQVIE